MFVLIRNIVFDMGGVLINYNTSETVHAYFPEKYHDLLMEKVFNARLWPELDRGTMRPDEVLPVLLPQLPEETRPLISKMVSDFYPYMPPSADMYTFVERVKKSGYSIYLLSNATPRFFDRYMDIPALRFFDGFFISALYKLMKPEREMYEAFCRKFSLRPEECFFIDDMKRNIDGARDFGMKGFVYKLPDTQSLEKALAAEGVKLVP